MNYNLKAGLSLFLVFTVFLWCFSPHNTIAQGLSFRNYSVKEGMSQSQIKDIVQDKEGYLWFATAEGLTRFDGRKFRHYSKKDGLANTFINKILIEAVNIDSDGSFKLYYNDGDLFLGKVICLVVNEDFVIEKAFLIG